MDVNITFYRRDGKRIYIKRPSLEELSFTQRLWSDFDTMADVGRVIDFPKYQWESFYKKNIDPTDRRNFYCLVYTQNDVPVGEASFHGYDSATKTARLNLRIHNNHRGNGYGKEAMRLILDYFFNGFGGEYIVEKVVDDKNRIILEKEGFKFINKNRNESIYRLEKEKFVSIEQGLVASRRVGVLTFPGVDMLSLSYATKLFNEVNEVEGREIFRLISIGDRSLDVINSGFIKCNIDEDIVDNHGRFDIVIIPGNLNIDALNRDDVIAFMKECANNCELIVAYEEGIIPLALSGALTGLKVCAPKRNRTTFKKILTTSLISEKSIIDNGRIVLFTGIDNILPGYMYIIKKICGEITYKSLINKLHVP